MADNQTIEPCRLLALPAELRNHIYELVTTRESEGQIDLFTARPQGTELLQLCQKTHAEAKGIVKQADDNFWASTNFTADVSTRALVSSFEFLDRLSEHRISLITKIVVHDSGYTFTRKDRHWEWHGRGGRSERYLITEKQCTESDSYLWSCWVSLPLSRPAIEGRRMSLVEIYDSEQGLSNEAEERYGSATLTRRELKRVMRLIKG